MRRPKRLIFLLLFAGLSAYLWLSFETDKRNFAQGQAAFVFLDCQSAIPYFNDVIETRGLLDWGAYAIPAREKKDACVLFQQAIAARKAGHYSEAVVVYIQLMNEPEGGTFRETAQSSLREMFAEANSEDLANQALCEMLKNTKNVREHFPEPNRIIPEILANCVSIYMSENDQDEAFAFAEKLLADFPGHPRSRYAAEWMAQHPRECISSFSVRLEESGYPEYVPQFYFSCARQFLEADRNHEAIRWLEYLIEEYPDDEKRPEAETILASLLIESARAAGSVPLPAPSGSGQPAGETITIEIQNNAPERLRIVFQGSISRIEELPPCEDCQRYFGSGPAFCPNKGPLARYTLPVGVYEVLVEASSDQGVIPFTGTWNLSTRASYDSCFFIVIMPIEKAALSAEMKGEI